MNEQNSFITTLSQYILQNNKKLQCGLSVKRIIDNTAMFLFLK